MGPHDFAAVLLDMDGTLVDSDAAVERSWRRWAAEHGVPMSTLEPRLHGNTALTTAIAVLPGRTADEHRHAAQRQLELEYADVSDIRATVGAAELLDTVRRLGLPWAVVTSADRRLAGIRLGAAGITPPVLVTVEDTAEGKPSPQPYLAAADRLGVDPARCLAVEDSAPGIRSARAAGARVATLRGLDGDHPVKDLRELATWLASGR
ncbi:HAD family hydrolase [Hamadaea tsunoensis]|uniref:HAD family hydrolase n=1 Tax=Hamadaea tsunoensis TaxID=53368 RepID=UPI00040E57DC|nr:HAD-IA family hydrolase [Hamadaea tsunoensis]